MASNVSNLLKEKIVTPVANSVAAQVDNKVKNGIILRKFIGVQLGESNTGCQLVKIDLNKINVKDPSYEFTLYIKAFSQKGLFNFIVNVNKTDSLQVDVKCELKNSDSNNGEAIGYYDVDTVGNTITISLVKAFVVNTSINECKFVSTKDTLNISDLDIDWSDTGNVKTSTSINIRYNQTSIYEYDEYFYTYKPDFADGEMHQIAKFDFSEILNKTLTKNKNFDIIIDIIYHSIGEFHICFDLMWMRNLNTINMIHGAYEKIPSQSSMEGRNFDELFKFCKKDNTTLLLLINPPAMYISGGKFVIRRIEVHRADADIESDLVKIDLTPEKLVNSDGSLVIGSIKKHTIDFTKVFTPSDSDNAVTCNGVVPHPTTSEADNKYLLGADAKWHPRKAGNEYIANLKPTEEIKGLSETDTTKGISFVTIDFNTLSQKVVEAAPSTLQDFDINMKVLTHDLGIITISTCLSVTTAGLVACSGVLSDRGMGSRSVSFSTTYSGKLGAVTTPGFFVNDRDTKILKIALYTPIAIDGVKIIDAVVTSYSDIIDESDIVFTWELGILEKKPYKPLTSNIIYPRIDLDRELVFDQMDIETPISETDEDTLFAEQIKHNGLVPAPGKYEVDNKYLLGADAKWHPRKAGNEYIANLKPTEEILGLTETDTTKGVSFVTIDFNALIQKIVEATPSTYQEFGLGMKVLVKQLGVVDINVDFSVTVTGVIACTGVTSNRGLNSGNFSITFDSKIGSIPSPGFFVNDYDTKIFKLALYTVFANNGVKIIEAQITSYSDLIDENDIICTWELGVLDKLPAQIGKSNEIYLGVDLPRNQTFRQMNIETPIAETEETTVEAEQLKYNGLVPAPGKYEVDNQYFLKADGSWDLPKNSINDYIALVTPSGEMADQTGTTTGVSFVTIDYSKAYEKLSLGTNETTGFRVYLTIFNETYGKLEIALRTIIVNLGENINQGVTAYADIGTESGGLSLQLVQIQNNYGEDIRTPIFTDIDPTIHKIRVGIYAVGINKPVIVKNCTIHQTHDTIDTHDIDIVWEANVVTFTEENTKSASQYTNINLNKTFSPILNMRDPEGSYSDSQVRRWRLENNGFVPAPAKYEADQGHVLCADGTWKKMESGSNFTAVPITLDPTKYQEAYETQTNPDTSKKTIMFMNLDISSIVATGTNITKIELSMYSPIYGTSRLVIDTMINSIKNQYCVNEDANGAGFYMDYCLAVAEVENSGFTGKDDTKIESFYTFVIDGDIIKIGISPIIFKLLNGTTPPFPIVTLEDCKVFIQSITDGSTSTDISEIPISYEQSTYTLNSVYGANHNGWIAKNTIFSAYVDYDTRDFQSLHNGLVPAPTKVEVEEGKFLKADGTWAIPPSTRGNDNYITKVERDPSTVDQVSATKATSFLTIDYSTICEQLGAATGDAGQADANIFTSLEVMVPVWGKIQISIVSLLSDNWFSVLVYSDAGTGWYTDNIAYKIHSDISDNELHTRPGFYTMDDVNKTITLGMYGSYGADEIAIIDCTSIAVGEGFSVDDMIYNYDRQLIDIPESAKDFDEIGITRNTVFQSMAYADTDPDGTKYLYQRGNYNGLVPAPAKYDVTHNYMLRPNGTWGPIEGIIRNRTFTVTPHTDSSSTQTNDYVITEGAEDLAIAINENYSVDINIVFSGLGSKNNTNTTLIITGVTGTVNLYDYSGNPIKYITDGMSMKCTIFKNTIDDPVESMNAYCIYDIVSYPDTINGPSE